MAVTDDGDRLQIFSRKSASDPYLSIPVSGELTMYSRGRLYGGQLFINGADNIDGLRKALTAEYGEPSFSNPAVNIYSWKWQGSPVKIEMYGSADSITLDFSNKAL